MEKKDVMLRLTQWAMMLQEFDLEIHDKRGTKNSVADHLSCLHNDHHIKWKDMPMTDAMLDESLMALEEMLHLFASIVTTRKQY